MWQKGGVTGLFVLGYDLNDDVSQVSYCGADSALPVTLSVTAGAEKYAVPTVLAKKKGVGQWCFGEEALQLDRDGEGVLVDCLLTKAKERRTLVIEEREFSAVSLLELFLRRTLALVNLTAQWQLADCIVITVETLDAETVAVLQEVTKGLPIEDHRIRFQSHMESFYDYVIHQPEELWKHEVFVLDDQKQCLKSYRLYLNRRTKPVVAFIEEKDFDPLTEQDGKVLLTAAEELLKNRTVSSVYLIGDGFDGEWAKEALRYLCMGRRVFQGKNLYTKGACYSAMEKAEPGGLQDDYVYLGNDKLKSNIGMKVIGEGRERYFPLADAGVNWYDVGGEHEFLLGKEKEVRLMLTPLTGKDVRWVVIRLLDFPDRPERASRVRMRVFMESENCFCVKVHDLGFGEIFPSSGKIICEKIELYEE